ncbi:MAG: hypothetical protein K0R90_1335 [Oscillospiraceae bacterium]|jgi:hypothetical protein|nr:hypothetical protein [Oscillospiraceae bacterium]
MREVIADNSFHFSFLLKGMVDISSLVFKQWIYQPNRSGTPKAISGMMNYIATRPGVELNSIPLEDELTLARNPDEVTDGRFVDYMATRPGVAEDDDIGHGLFGKMLNMKEQSNIEDLSLARGYVENLAHKKITVFNAVISLKEEDAIDKEITKKEDWENLIKDNIYDISREMGIPPRSLEYCCAVHMEKGHPHLHLMYWNKEQKAGINFIQPALSNSIRRKLIRNLYGEELKEVQQEKDTIKKEIMNMIAGENPSVLNEQKSIFKNLSSKEMYKLSQIYKENKFKKILNRRVATKQAVGFASDILTIHKEIRKIYPKGAFKYQYLPEQLKDQLSQLTGKILISNPDIAKEYKKYLSTVQKQAEFFGGKKNVKEYVRKADYEIKKNISNKILSVIKDLRKLENTSLYTHKKELKQNQILVAKTVSLMQDVLNSVCTKTDDVNKSMQSTKGYNDMSQAQKAELRKKLKDHSLEWGD